MNVVLYMRYSSDRQTEQSIEGQQRVCREFCKREGYKIVGEYIDRATSAYKGAEKRTEFQRMIKDSEKQLWNGVVVYKLDRFARNRYDSATYKAKLKRNGVKVISATENISDNPEGIILESVLEGMAEFYSRELSQKVTRGMRESAYKCQSLGGFVSLGYKVVDKHFVINEAEAAIVREAFAMYANGATVADICNTFNKKGYRTNRGAKFNKNSFKTMFRNERYIGTYIYKDVRIPNGMPAIVDEKIFETVRKRVAMNEQAPARGKAKVDYLLAQKLYCGHCGAPMIGESGTSKTGDVHNYYTCTTRRRQHACDKKPLRKELIERWVVEDTMRLLTPEAIDTIAEKLHQMLEDEAKQDSRIPEAEKKIRDTDKRIENLLKLAETGLRSESVSVRIAELEEIKAAAQLQLADVHSEHVHLEKKVIADWLTLFAHGDVDDEDFRKHLCDALVNSVTVWDEPDGYKITCIYNISEDNTRTFRIDKDGENSSCGGTGGSPRYPKPNYLFFFGTYFGQTTRHRTE